MLVLEYKVKGMQRQYQAIDEAIRTTQFIRNKAIRYWMDAPKEQKVDKIALNNYSTALRKEFGFVKELNSMACQAATERAWLSIARFYDNCKSKKQGKKTPYVSSRETLSPVACCGKPSHSTGSPT